MAYATRGPSKSQRSEVGGGKKEGRKEGWEGGNSTENHLWLFYTDWQPLELQVKPYGSRPSVSTTLILSSSTTK